MKEMVYSKKIKREVLYSGTYKGYDFYILNLGWFPTAYVKIPEEHKYYKMHYDDVNIDVHGGLTYSRGFLDLENECVFGWFIGWDYGHCNDYCSLHGGLPFVRGDKKWKTEEVYEDVKNVIEQLIEVENE